MTAVTNHGPMDASVHRRRISESDKELLFQDLKGRIDESEETFGTSGTFEESSSREETPETDVPVNDEKRSLPSPGDIAALLPDTFSIDSLRQGGVVPLREEDGIMIVAAPSMKDYASAQLLGIALGKAVEIEVHDEESIGKLLRGLYDLRSGVADEAAQDMEGIDDIDDLVREDVLSDSVDVPVIRLVNGLLVDAVKQRATDVHIEPYENYVIVRFRIDGVLHDRLRLPRTHQAPLTSRVKVMARMDIAEHMVPQDGRIAINVGDHAVDIRASSIPTQHGERLALRILNKGAGVLTLEELGMSPVESQKMEKFISSPYGMILFTGPTGSGKTTSMYAILQALARPDVNIITVEDPIEYDLPGIAQIQVNEKAGLTFASSLRSILRQDPDIVMIGEMRDYETAHIGVQASLTGHLVLSTLHTNDSISAVARLVDMGIEPYLVAGSLVGVVAQRLVRRVCPRCKREIEPPELLRRQGIDRAYRGMGCDYCRGTGYRGRVGIYEQLVVDEAVQDAIATSKPAQTVRSLAEKSGFRTIWDIGLDLVRKGLTSPQELIRVAGEV